MAFRATYTSFGTFIGDGSVQVNVVGAPVVLPGGIDADRDGFIAGQDCRDDNPSDPARRDGDQGQQHRRELRRGGRAVPDARGGRGARLVMEEARADFTLKALQITQQFPKGWKVQIKCSGKKCPFKSKTLKAGEGQEAGVERDLVAVDEAAQFRAGQTIEIWVSAPNFNTKVARITLKKGKQPATRAVLRAARIVEGPKDLHVMHF